MALSRLQEYRNNLRKPLSGFGDTNDVAVSARIARNINNPITNREVEKLYGSADDFLERYRNFEGVYKNFLKREFEGAQTVGRKRALEAAQISPVININLLRDYKNKQALNSMLRDTNLLNIGGMIQTFGAPRTTTSVSKLI